MSKVSKRAVAMAVVIGAAAALLATSAHSARQAVTSSSITTPSDLSYFVYQKNTPNTFAVSGTSSGTTGDHVDLLCYYGGSSFHTMASNVAVNGNGTFSAPAVSLSGAGKTPCRLRAVPAGTTPAALSAFAGPRILVDTNKTLTVTGGPNNGKLYDYFSLFQQLGGSFDYESLSGCGVCDGYLSDASFNLSTITYWSNAALYTLRSGPVLRSELQVDGANAYPTWSAESINADATGLPVLTYRYALDKKTGNVVIHETEPFVKCANATYPPTAVTCPSFESAGITDKVTIMQDHNGRVAWASELFTSTDGKAHALDLRWDNSQRFHGGSGDASQLEYKFPGEKTYSRHVLSDDPSIASGPGTIFIRMHGAPDGDTGTGQGAIVYDRTATDAYFRSIDPGDESFMLHQTAKVKAHGSTRFRFAYIQGYKYADVAAAAKLASAVYRGCVVPAVAGKTLRAATRLLKHANCAVGKVTHAHSSTITKNTVIASKPRAGSHLAYKARVALLVSTG